jgi:hypothetical protein
VHTAENDVRDDSESRESYYSRSSNAYSCIEYRIAEIAQSIRDIAYAIPHRFCFAGANRKPHPQSRDVPCTGIASFANSIRFWIQGRKNQGQRNTARRADLKQFPARAHVRAREDFRTVAVTYANITSFAKSERILAAARGREDASED